MTKNVEAWLDTPDFAEEMRASQVKIEVVFLYTMRKYSE